MFIFLIYIQDSEYLKHNQECHTGICNAKKQ